MKLSCVNCWFTALDPRVLYFLVSRGLTPNRGRKMKAIASLLILQPLLVFGAHHDIDFLVEEWVVDFMRPTKSGVKKEAERVTPFHIPDDNRKVTE